MVDETVNIGIIGCGHWGSRWVRIFQEAGACVKALCDLNKQKLKEASFEASEAASFRDYREMLDDDNIDAVYIATPPTNHFEIAKFFLLARKHVLVEKPMTTNSERAMELVRLAKKKNTILMVGDTFIYNRAIQEMKRIIDTGQIGALRYAQSYRTNSVDMWDGRTIYCNLDVLWDLAPHEFSIIRYLVGQEFSTISVTCPPPLSSMTNHQLVTDAAIIRLCFAGGVQCLSFIRWIDQSRNRRIIIFGQKGIVSCDDPTRRDSTTIKIEKFFLDDLRLREHSIKTYEVDVSDTLENECKHFLSCIKDGKTPLTSGEHGVAIVRALEAGQRSMNNGGESEKIDDYLKSQQAIFHCNYLRAI